ncbi:hypothetical protein VZT92_026774 [Zoarces viviparus]|uniref:Uncharacterized protein n=1 Tax=Zoarces viviparus TaxID=48416 RepID=A0AAW1DS01_ZOAVI
MSRKSRLRRSGDRPGCRGANSCLPYPAPTAPPSGEVLLHALVPEFWKSYQAQQGLLHSAADVEEEKNAERGEGVSTVGLR